MRAAWLEVVQRAQLLRVGVGVPALFMVCERQPAGNGVCFGVRGPSRALPVVSAVGVLLCSVFGFLSWSGRVVLNGVCTSVWLVWLGWCGPVHVCRGAHVRARAANQRPFARLQGQISCQHFLIIEIERTCISMLARSCCFEFCVCVVLVSLTLARRICLSSWSS